MSTAAPTLRERDAIVKALAAGTIPALGLHHIRVGRRREAEAALRDVARVADGGAAFRLITGERQSGKSFFLRLIRDAALAQGLATAHTRLSSELRLSGTAGQPGALLEDAMRSLSVAEKPDGAALDVLLDRFLAQDPGAVRDGLMELRERVGGGAFAQAVVAYRKGAASGDATAKAAAVSWVAGEIRSRREARRRLGFRDVAGDRSILDHFKLVACLAKLAGFGGLLVLCDDLDAIGFWHSDVARSRNYEQVLRIVNDAYQDADSGLGTVFAMSASNMRDVRRGVASYGALGSRLAVKRFGRGEFVDLSGPVLGLDLFSADEMKEIFRRVRDVAFSASRRRNAVPDAAIDAFAEHHVMRDLEYEPRKMICAFVQFLERMSARRSPDWNGLMPDFMGEVERRKWFDWGF